MILLLTPNKRLFSSGAITEGVGAGEGGKYEEYHFYKRSKISFEIDLVIWKFDWDDIVSSSSHWSDN